MAAQHDQPSPPRHGEDIPQNTATASYRNVRRILTLTAAAALAALLTVGAWLGYLVHRVHVYSTLDEARAADAIIVLGAAAYRGRPSPVLKARLDHGLTLYQRGLAPRIVTTGGAGGDPDFTESEVGRAYLIRQGVPSEAIILEPNGDSTAYSAAAVSEIMRRMNLSSCIVVSDGYHVFRAKRLLEDQGLTAYGSPRPEPPRNDWGHWKLCARQAAGYLLWRVGIRV